MRISTWLGAGIALLLLGNSAFSQQLKLGKNPYTVQKSAVLELNSDNQGLLLVRISDTTLINSLAPPDGMIIFFTPLKQLLVRSNGYWQMLVVGSAISSLNGQTGSIQTFAAGTSGTDFTISSAGAVHTFNLPDASATARGVITTGAQTIAGSKTFSSAPLFSSLTAGSVPFIGTGGLLSQNNASLFWDATNSRLGIGTNTPSQKMDVRGAIVSSATTYPNYAYNSANRMAFGESNVPANETGSVIQFGSGSNTRNMLFAFTKTNVNTSFFGNDGTQMMLGSESTVPITFRTGLVYTAANVMASGTEVMRLTSAGFLGIGTTSPSTALHVAGTNPLTLVGVQTGTSTSADSLLTITSGLVRKLPISTFFTTIDTSNISNFYLKVRAELAAGTGISYNSSTGVIANSGVLSVNGNTGALTMDTGYISNFYQKTRSLFSGVAPITFNTAGQIGITQATTSTNGYLSSTDWNTFNNKASAANTWSFGGNTVTTAKNLGTIDNNDLPFITNNTEKMRLSATGNLGIGATTFDGTNPEKLLVNAGTTSSVNAIAGKGTINSYLQLNIQNQSAGTAASSDVVATADNGSETTNYVDLGINSSGNTSGYFGAANDAYLYNLGQNFLFGTGTAGKSLVFMTGGGTQSTNERMRIDGNGKVGIGTATPSTMLHVAGTNPLTLNGVQTGTSTSADSLLTITSGLVRKLPISTFATPISTGNLTETGSSILTITGGTNAVVGSGTSVQVKQASTSQNGFLSSTDWNIFNNKASAANTWAFGGNTVGSVKTLGTIDNYDLPFITGNTERMRLSSSGNLGIGVTNPANPLVVKDTFEIRRTGTMSEILFSNTAGAGDFRIAGDGGDIYWQGGGGRNLQMGAYWGIQLGGDRQTTTLPSFSAGTGNTGVLVQAQRDASVPLAIQANSATQSANLTEWRSSSATLNVMDKNGSLAIGATSFDGTNPEKLLVNAGTTSSVNAIVGKGNINNYLQLNIQNQNAGTNASSDIVATADNGTETVNYVDLGINSSINNAGIMGGANDAYLYSTGNNFLIGAGTAAKSLVFMTGGTTQATNERMRIDGNGNAGIGTNAPTNMLHVSGTNPLRLVGLQSGAAADSLLTVDATGVVRKRRVADELSGSGISSLNGLTGITQTFATGTAGTDFAISSSGTTHTFNIPDASATARGLVTTGAQTMAGSKTFSSAPLFSSLTAGSVPFIGTGGLLSQNNAAFFWDATNNRLGVGTNTPGSDLTVIQNSGSTSSRGIRLNGNSIGGTNTGSGFSMALGYNQANNKQIWMGDPDYLGNVTGTFGRFSTSNGITIFDAIAGDNSVRRPIQFGVAGDPLSAIILGYDGTSTAPGSYVWANGNMAIGNSYRANGAPSNGLIVQGNTGIGTTAPTAALHLRAGTTTASSGAPLKFTSGTSLTTAEDGAVEYDGTNYFATAGTTRYTLAKTLTATATLNFGSTAPGNSSALTITVTGAADGDVVSVGVPNAIAATNGVCYTAFVSAANTVTVKFNNYSTSSVDPASATIRVSVIKY